MNAAAWVFAGALVIALLLLVLMQKGNEDLARESRRLRRTLAAAKRPGLRVVGRDGGAA